MRHTKLCKVIRGEAGVVFLVVGMLIAVLIGLVALSIDFGYIYMVKGQLRNAADTGALAGAGTIYPGNTPPPASFPLPNFTNAQATAAEFIKKNTAAGVNLTDTDIVSIKTGYWNLSRTPRDIQPQTTTPKGTCSSSGIMCTSNLGCATNEACLIQDVPAVQVTVQKTVATFFARFAGLDALSPGATAVAVIGYPRSAQVFPLAVTKCLVDSYFQQSPLPDPPDQITIWGPYGHGVPNCNTGEWTSLNTGNGSGNIRRLMYNIQSSPLLAIGDTIAIDAGDRSSLTNEIKNKFINSVVVLPVVADPVLATGTITPITGFVAFQFVGVMDNGANSQVVGRLRAYYNQGNASGPGGPKANSVTPPVLVK